MPINQMLADLHRRRENKKLQVVIEGLQSRKQELAVFFDEYLELFDEQMSATEDQNDPIWKAYTVRYKEWQQINKDLKLADYYMRMV